MTNDILPGDLPVSPAALRALTEWTFAFSGELRARVVELACRGDSPSTITVELVRQAVVLACEETAAAVSPERGGQRNGTRGNIEKAA